MSIQSFSDDRVVSYKRVSDEFPHARNRELDLLRLTANLAFETGSHALDLGSGDGFVAHVLCEAGYRLSTVDGAFPALPFSLEHWQYDLCQGLPGAVPTGKYLLISSNACLHHVANPDGGLPEALVDDISRVAAPGCSLCLQDVPAPWVYRGQETFESRSASLTASFFTDIVDQFCVPSHEANYADFSLISAQFSRRGWVLNNVLFFPCSWVFDSRDGAINYIRGLFNLGCSMGCLEKVIDTRLHASDMGVEFEWALSHLSMTYSG